MINFLPKILMSNLIAQPIATPSPSSAPASFGLRARHIGSDFLNTFEWFTADDPTHGRVNYVDKDTALRRNLTFADRSKFVMRADDVSQVLASSSGRDSVRISSIDAYEDSIIVLDVQHMPWGCGTWPAFWTVSPQQWPYGGEIDIIEGVNLQMQNLASLHTSSNCTIPDRLNQTGIINSDDCDAFANQNQGCGALFTKQDNYGDLLNEVGGGYFVMKRTQAEGAFVWFWARNDTSAPPEIVRGALRLTPNESWGLPEARFPTDYCDFTTHFDAHQIVFDLTFCGDWAGNAYSADGCPGLCGDYVDNYPAAFSDAYWEVNALRVYTP